LGLDDLPDGATDWPAACPSAFTPGAFTPIEQCTVRSRAGAATAATWLRRAYTGPCGNGTCCAGARALGLDAGVLAAAVLRPSTA
jgi:hypothetical protein